MASCVACKKIFDKKLKDKDKIKCLICKKKFCNQCVNVDEQICAALCDHNNWKWYCNNCVSKTYNSNESSVLKLCQEILEKVNNLEKKICDQNKIINDLNKQRDCVSVTSVTPVVTRSRAQASASNSASGANNAHTNSGTSKRRHADYAADYGNGSDDPDSRSAKRVRVTSNKSTQNDNKSEPILVVSAANANVKNVLLSKVKANLDPVNDPVTRVSTSASGKVIVRCKTDAALNIVMKKLADNIGSDATVTTPPPLQPRLQVLGVNPEYVAEISVKNSTDSEDQIPMDNDNPTDAVMNEGEKKATESNNSQLIEMIRKQNQELLHDQSKLEVLSTMKRKDGSFNVIIVCDVKSMEKILTRGRLKIGWDSCLVNEHINLYRCFICNRYGHGSSECKDKESGNTCPRCAGRHKISECDPGASVCCSNCKAFNDRNGLNVRTDHPVWDSRCTVQQRKFSQRKENIKYSS